MASYKLGINGKPIMVQPIIEEIKKENRKSDLQVSAKDKQQLVNILRKYKTKYPSIDIEELLSKDVIKEEFLDDKLHTTLTFGGQDCFKAI